jgi:hypothetical protein
MPEKCLSEQPPIHLPRKSKLKPATVYWYLQFLVTINHLGGVMINEISLILLKFRTCFSREAAFNWFVMVIMGFIIRLDHYGVTSFIRWLGLKPSLYTSLLSLFRASSWQIERIQRCWYQIIWSHCPLIQIGGRYLLAGDGIKISKEAEKMPGVKKLHQESDNSGKAKFIYGHHHGVVGILAGWVKKNLLRAPLCRTA